MSIKIKNRGEQVIIERVGTFAAAALRYQDVGAGLMNIYHEWEDRYVLYRARVEILQDETGQPIVSAGATLTDSLVEKVVGNVRSPERYIIFWAERNGGLRDNRTEWSHGDGMERNGNRHLITRPGYLTTVSLKLDIAPTRTCAVEVRINNVAVAAVYPAIGQNATINRLSDPVRVYEDDQLHFRTVLSGKAKFGTVQAEITLTQNDDE